LLRGQTLPTSPERAQRRRLRRLPESSQKPTSGPPIGFKEMVLNRVKYIEYDELKEPNKRFTDLPLDDKHIIHGQDTLGSRIFSVKIQCFVVIECNAIH
jgi:hypothetical protein